MHDVSSKWRRRLLGWANTALEAVDPAHRVAAALQDYPQHSAAVLAFGKAACGMMDGAKQALDARIERALLIGPISPPMPLPPRWEFHAGDHPLPGANSLAAGDAVAVWLRDLPTSLPLLVMISGGGSALVELPVGGMTLASLQRMNRWLLASGLDIHRINAIRSRFSRLKHGGLLRHAGARDITGLLLSDVPGDDVAGIASGPLSPAPFDWPAVEKPDWLEHLHIELPMPSTGAAESHPGIRIIARNDDALDAVVRAAAEAGAALETRGRLSGPAADAGTMIARRVRCAPPGIHVFGGETTVHLPEKPGSGGRNQQLALAAAVEIAGEKNVLLLALGTNGIDGNTEDAGALVDGHTLGRIRDAGLDPVECLATADSNTALSAAGDVIHTGPTGTNVMDIVIALKFA